MRGPLTPGRRERPGASPAAGAAHRRWIAAAAALVVATATSLALPAPAHGSDDTPTQWQIDARAEALQRAPEPAEKPVICIIDTGVTPTPDLDIVSRTALDGGTPDDVTAIPGHYGHGTTVAHMAAAKVNGWGSSGAFPHARIASVRIFDRLDQRVPWERYVRAIRWCADVRPRPVAAILSLGRPASSAAEMLELQSEIVRRRDRDNMSIVAAAGNGGGQPDVPARLPEALGVAGAWSTAHFCESSARGEGIDVAAPGCDLLQAGWDGTPWRLTGTSFAAPIVAASLAALRAYDAASTAAATEAVLMGATAAGAVRHIDVAAALRVSAQELLTETGENPPGRPDERERPPGPAEIDAPAGPAALAQPPMPRLLPGLHHLTPLPRPSGIATRTGRRVTLRIRNRPAFAFVDVRTARRSVSRARDVVMLRTPVKTLRVRFRLRAASGPSIRLSVKPE